MRPSVTKMMNYFEENGILKDWKFHVYPEDDFKEKHIRFTPIKGITQIGNEIYGKDARLYIYCVSNEAAHKIAKIIRVVFKVKSEFHSATKLEVPVSYFKGNRWWE